MHVFTLLQIGSQEGVNGQFGPELASAPPLPRAPDRKKVTPQIFLQHGFGDMAAQHSSPRA
jgi:hypothetical protein